MKKLLTLLALVGMGAFFAGCGEPTSTPSKPAKPGAAAPGGAAVPGAVSPAPPAEGEKKGDDAAADEEKDKDADNGDEKEQE